MAQDNDMLTDIFSIDDNRSQAIKTNTITGDRFILHSLPKEFQDWHNIYYILEKEAKIDNRAISEAILNGYMWKAIFDGVEYGIGAFFTVMWSAIKLKLSYSVFSFILTMIVFIPVFLYFGWHNAFYAMIRAQIIGPVTKKSAEATVYNYLSSMWGTFASLTVAFLVTLSFLFSILPVIAYGIYLYHQAYNDGTDSLAVWFEEFMIVLHNMLVSLSISGDGIFNNIYVITLSLFLFGAVIIYGLDRLFFLKNRKIIVKEMISINREKFYPVEVAQKILREWKAQANLRAKAA